MQRAPLTLAFALVLIGSAFAEPAAPEVTTAMKKAAEFYHDKVARHGGYVYYTSWDLSKRLGEGVATEDQIWVQPPGTPTVGMAYLKAFQATEDRFYLDAAVETAEALIYGQLKSGAWTNLVDFNPRSDRAGLYRNGQGRGRNFSTLDDGISQAAIQFLVRLDKETRFQNKAIHEAAEIALEALLKAQFRNGSFPQGWDEVPQPEGLSADKKANYPDYDWRTEGRIKEYWDMFTLNDGLALSVSDTLIEAHIVYQDERYSNALKRLGQFLILSQMPDPQPAWAQQYNYDMQPIWARKFEPAAISGRESEGVIVTLMKLAAYFRDKQYLEPIPRALAYLKKSELKDGKLARYYELESNKPLYMERNGKTYTLTYDDSRLPSHYGWKTFSHLKAIEAAFETLSQTGKMLPVDQILPPLEPVPTVDGVLAALDEEGRWVSIFGGELLVGQPKFQPDEEYIDSAVFCRNLEMLSEFLQSN